MGTGQTGAARARVARRASGEAAQRVYALIRRRPDARPTLHALARTHGVSVAALCAAFRREYGHSIHQTRLALRLDAAARAVSAGCADLTTLALELGFSSHSHMTARFRAHFGVTPSAVRSTPCRSRSRGSQA